MSATSARGAAMKILLEDFEPIIERTEKLAATLAEVRGEINADLTMLGVLVQRTVDVQPSVLEAAKKLSGAAARIEAAVQQSATAPAVAARTSAPSIWLACLVSAVAAAALVGGGFYLVGQDTFEQARIGRALQKAWPTIDPATREKVQGAIGK